MKRRTILFLGFCIWAGVFQAAAQPSIALLKYKGGGDWYANPTSLPNLARFCNKELNTNLPIDIPAVEVGSPELFSHPFIHLTGHGNIIFSDQEADNMRKYLMGGGFLHADDNYGLDKYFRVAMKKVFPELELIELPYNHPIYHQKFDFNNGLPKIHEHDGKPAKGYGLFWEGRLVCFYTHECDLGDGWENPEVHRDPQEVHEKALKMGANIVQFAFTQ